MENEWKLLLCLNNCMIIDRSLAVARRLNMLLQFLLYISLQLALADFGGGMVGVHMETGQKLP